MLGGDPADHLEDDDRLAHAGPTEHADLAALDVGGEQVDDLDAGLEHHGLRREVLELRGRPVDVPAGDDALGDGLAPRVERLADDVEHVAEHAVADGDGDPVAGVVHDRSPDPALADVLGHLGRDLDLAPLELDGHLQRVVDLGQRVGRELDVDDGAGDGDDAAVLERGLGRGARLGGQRHAISSCRWAMNSSSRPVVSA